MRRKQRVLPASRQAFHCTLFEAFRILLLLYQTPEAPRNVAGSSLDPKQTKLIKFIQTLLSNTDTSVVQTLSPVPLVSARDFPLYYLNPVPNPGTGLGHFTREGGVNWYQAWRREQCPFVSRANRW